MAAVHLAIWRRIVLEGGGPELTLPEAAVLLGTSVESVRRRIKAGEIEATRDGHGRIRVRVALPFGTPEARGAAEALSLRKELASAQGRLAAAAGEAQGLRQELGLAHLHRREAQRELQLLQVEAQALRDELATARQALEHTQSELASLWRVMSSRQVRSSPALKDLAETNDAFDLPPARERLGSERSRIQGQIARVRDLSRRRRWPWPQAS